MALLPIPCAGMLFVALRLMLLLLLVLLVCGLVHVRAGFLIGVTEADVGSLQRGWFLSSLAR